MAKANQSATLSDGRKVTVVEVKGDKAEVIVTGTDNRLSVPVKNLK
jgi:hypothetical protein